MEKDIKKESADEQGPKNISSGQRRVKNKINSFLNANFQYVSLLVLALIFLFSFNYILLPKYEKVVVESIKVLDSKRDDFVSEYRELLTYRKNIDIYNSLDSDDVEKVKKMIPNESSRDEIFTEFVYFLMKNNFNVKSLKVLDLPSGDGAVVTNPSSPISRRTISDSSAGDSEFDQQTVKLVTSLPPDISAWVIKAEVSAIDYVGLKYLVNIIENNLRIADVTALNYNPSEGSVYLEVVTYYLKK